MRGAPHASGGHRAREKTRAEQGGECGGIRGSHSEVGAKEGLTEKVAWSKGVKGEPVSP